MAHGSRILIADDDEAIRTALAFALAGEGYRPQEARSVEEVRSALLHEQWSLVLLDTLGTTGDERERFLLEVCELAGDTAVVLMTGWTDIARWAEEACPVAGVVTKPFDVPQLLRRVAEIVR